MLDHGGFDMVYLIVSPRNPFKDQSLECSDRERYDAAVQTIERLGLSDRIKVDDIELSMPRPSYTINTLDALREREKDNRFTLVIGADNLPDMLKWREGERILTDYGIVVYPREGYNMVHDCATLKLQYKNSVRVFSPGAKAKPLHIKLLREAAQVNISSTEIRGMIARGETPPEVK